MRQGGRLLLLGGGGGRGRAGERKGWCVRKREGEMGRGEWIGSLGVEGKEDGIIGL